MSMEEIKKGEVIPSPDVSEHEAPPSYLAVSELRCKDSEKNRFWQVKEPYLYVVPYLTDHIGFSCEMAGFGHSKVVAGTEADLGKFFRSYIAEVDGSPFKWKNKETICFWSDKYGWVTGDIDALRNIIRLTMQCCLMGEVYVFNSPKKIANEVMSVLIHDEDKKYIADTNVLAFNNGILDLSSMELKPFTKEYTPKFKINFDYDPTAGCPMFLKVLTDALDQEQALLFQELCGNLLMDYKHEKIAILIGVGSNGKSTLLEAITEAFGSEDVSHYNLAQITDRSGIFLANMLDKVANISYESSSLTVSNEDLFKTYVSGESMTVKRLYKQPTTTREYPKSIVAANYLPQTTDYSMGFYRRIVPIQFNKTIPDEKADINMKSKLKQERAGVLNWVLDGLVRLRENGKFTESEAVKQTLQEYRLETDAVAAFLDAMNYVVCDSPMFTLSELFKEFKNWSFECGYKPMTIKSFSKRLRFLRYHVEKRGGTVKVWLKKQQDEIW